MIWAFESVNVAESLKPGAFKVTVHSEDRRRCLGETTILYIDLVEDVLERVISCPKASLKFIKAITACQNVHSEGGASDEENHTIDGRYLLSFPLSLNFNSLFF